MLISHNRHYINVGFVIYALTYVGFVASVIGLGGIEEGAVIGVLAAILVFLQNWLRIY